LPSTESECRNWLPASSLTDNGDALIGPVTEPWTSIKLPQLWPEWQRHARCAEEGLEKYFGSDSDIRPTMSTRQVREAQDTCKTCPVLGQCLAWALENKEEYGVWGGTSGRTRRRIWRWIREGFVTAEQVVEDVSNGKGYLYEQDLDDEAIA
jgi:WhiB family redox-sensing transcriptional regulator